VKFLAAMAILGLVVAGCGKENASGSAVPGASVSSTGAPSEEPLPTPAPQAPPAIVIDPDVFTYQEDLGYSNETFVVTGAEDDRVVVAALNRAAARFMRVDETGEEHFSDAGATAAYAAGLYTPNYVSDPKVTGRGVELYLDCKGAIEDPMAVTLRTILRQELEWAGVHAHVEAVT